jgi:DNA damage-binding protein 1
MFVEKLWNLLVSIMWPTWFQNFCEVISQFEHRFILPITAAGSIASQDKNREDFLKPELSFFTSSGRICEIIDVQDENLSIHLTELQRNMAALISDVDGVNHTLYVSHAIFLVCQ